MYKAGVTDDEWEKISDFAHSVSQSIVEDYERELEENPLGALVSMTLYIDNPNGTNYEENYIRKDASSWTTESGKIISESEMISLSEDNNVYFVETVDIHKELHGWARN